MNKTSWKKKAWKIYKIALLIVSPFSLSLLGKRIFPTKASVLAEQKKPE
jgi:hypothetical protein